MSSNAVVHDDSENFKILVATDLHLGFEEKNLVRADDTFNTFEEVLQLAVKHEVDFILLAGDLFHVNQPSVSSLERCISLLRHYCLGDKPINMEFVCDQAEVFKHCNNPIVNFEDQNLNVSIPVFSIHGNHDDPCGYREVSCMDLLSSMGLINYFGKQTNLQELKINPILLKKGSNKLAIYGLSHIRDERLERLFKEKKVFMNRPLEDVDDWFNIFVCHQNRVNRPGTKYLSEKCIPSHIMLTIWGHEHESLIDPVRGESNSGYICQPGSTVATSMCEGEAGNKYVGLLTISGKHFRMEPLELKTVRLMHFETVKLSECEEDVSTSKKTQEFVRRQIEDILSRLSLKYSGHNKQPKLPLIRLRVEYTNETQHFNGIQFGHEFQDRVANSNDMILLRMEKKSVQKKTRCIDDQVLSNIMDDEEMEKIEHIVDQYFRTASEENQLELLSVDGMAEAVDWLVNKSCHDAIKRVVEHQKKKMKNYVIKQEGLDENNISEHIISYHSSRTQKSKDEANDVREVLSSQQHTTQSYSDNDSNISPVNSDDEEISNNSSTSSVQNVRGKRGRGGRAPRATTRARGRARGQTTLRF
ncbi:LOW QUALITY PROTEIN: double-strand break repair protein MRE11 [Acyrthosiphon pisum]|uniref:Double-strand break repair protein n=1 Tax=Acyrthosiphon pisum TaxID=7029 RepID=A0A8R2B7I3_ACYPI|nr:LOW QUALITY PROTEIN: double-strand break repair protein MRE11 [Acyrthosiphon pisum]|eukprot:XP_008185560.1 PREDICTED: LOW QUALITY PROTEIN: double-strand break repair protein MRE11A [Acyrthosiphon pisum]